MHCSDASMIGGASFFADNKDWHISETKIVGKYQNLIGNVFQNS